MRTTMKAAVQLGKTGSVSLNLLEGCEKQLFSRVWRGEKEEEAYSEYEQNTNLFRIRTDFVFALKKIMSGSLSSIWF